MTHVPEVRVLDKGSSKPARYAKCLGLSPSFDGDNILVSWSSDENLHNLHKVSIKTPNHILHNQSLSLFSILPELKI